MSSRFRGVSRDASRRSERWKAYITDGHGKTRYLGTFHDELEAAKAYDRAATQLHASPTLNFPEDKRVRERGTRKQWSRKPSSAFRGVCLTPNGTWAAQLRRTGEKRWLGTFADEVDAARAYDRAVKKLKLDRPINFPDDEDLHTESEAAAASHDEQASESSLDSDWTVDEEDTAVKNEEDGADSDDKDTDKHEGGRATSPEPRRSHYPVSASAATPQMADASAANVSSASRARFASSPAPSSSSSAILVKPDASINSMATAPNPLGGTADVHLVAMVDLSQDDGAAAASSAPTSSSVSDPPSLACARTHNVPLPTPPPPPLNACAASVTIDSCNIDLCDRSDAGPLATPPPTLSTAAVIASTSTASSASNVQRSEIVTQLRSALVAANMQGSSNDEGAQQRLVAAYALTFKLEFKGDLHEFIDETVLNAYGPMDLSDHGHRALLAQLFLARFLS